MLPASARPAASTTRPGFPVGGAGSDSDCPTMLVRDPPKTVAEVPLGHDPANAAQPAFQDPRAWRMRSGTLCDDDIVNASTKAKSPGDVMRAMVAAFDTGDVADLKSFVDHGYFDHQGLPHQRPIRGLDGFRHVVEVARGGYSELSVSIVDLIEGVDRAAARLVWAGVRRTGEYSTRETLEIVRVDAGKAVEHWGGHS